MYYAVYNCNWYLLPVKMQRVFLVLLLRTQTPTVLKSGTIELDLNLFVAVSDDSHTKHLIRTLSNNDFAGNEEHLFSWYAVARICRIVFGMHFGFGTTKL